MALVEPTQLQTYLQRPLDGATAALAVRVAEGWLRSVIPTSAVPRWPEPPPEDLWAWALELAAIAYSNPESLSTRTVDAVTDAWSAARRGEILDAAARRYGTGASGPMFSFPPPAPWPGTVR